MIIITSILNSIDINNMVADEFTTFPGLYPTIGGKLVKRGPFTSKAAMNAALDSDAERQALKAYDKGSVIKPRDADLYGYKNAGFYFKGKGGDMGSGGQRKARQRWQKKPVSGHGSSST